MNPASAFLRATRLFLSLYLLPALLPFTQADPIGDALNQPGLTWQTSPPFAWHVQPDITHDGISALQYVGVDKLTVTTTVNGPLQVSFWWKTESRFSNGYFSFLSTDLTNPKNLVSFRQITGTNDWQQVSIGIDPGPHQLLWTLSTSSGWLDEVTFSDRQPEVPFFGKGVEDQPFSKTVLAGTTISLLSKVGGFPLSLQWLRDGQPIPGATNNLLTFSNAPASVTGHYQLVASNQLGVVSNKSVAIYVAQPLTLTPLAKYTVTNGTIRSVGFFPQPAVNPVPITGPTHKRPVRWGGAKGTSQELDNLAIDLVAEVKEGANVSLGAKRLIFSGGKLIEIDNSPTSTSEKPALFRGRDSNGDVLATYTPKEDFFLHISRTHLGNPGGNPDLEDIHTGFRLSAMGVSEVQGRKPQLIFLSRTSPAFRSLFLLPDGDIDRQSLTPEFTSDDLKRLAPTVMSVDKDKIAVGSPNGVAVFKIGPDGQIRLFANLPVDLTFPAAVSKITIKAGTPGTNEPDLVTVINQSQNIVSTYAFSTDAEGNVKVSPRNSNAPSNDLNRSASTTDVAQGSTVCAEGVRVPNVGGKLMIYDCAAVTLDGAFLQSLLVGQADCGSNPNADTVVAVGDGLVLGANGNTATLYAKTGKGQAPYLFLEPDDYQIGPQDGSFELSVLAVGDEPLTYQWIKKRNGVEEPITTWPPGSPTTSDVLTLPGIDFNPPAGSPKGTLIDPTVIADYYVRVTNPFGSVDSRLANVSRSAELKPQLDQQLMRDGSIELSYLDGFTDAVLQVSFDLKNWDNAVDNVDFTTVKVGGKVVAQIKAQDNRGRFYRLYFPNRN